MSWKLIPNIFKPYTAIHIYLYQFFSLLLLIKIVDIENTALHPQ